jgi:hypothetical protein
VPAALGLASILISLAQAAPAEAARLAAAAALQAGAPATAPMQTIDPVVREVVRMLGSHVSEEVILHWLETSGRRPAVVGSRELIELRRAGSPDKVTEKLLDMVAKKPSGGSSAAKSGDPVAGAADPPPAQQAKAADLQVSPGPHGAPFHWVVSYHPNFLEDDERWDLYVYLDGRYLAWAKTPLVSFLEKPLEFDRKLPPGHHVLRLFEERHVRKPNTNEWVNQARVAPAAFEFDIAPDTPGRIEVLVEVRTRGGPVQLTVTQGAAEIAKAQPKMPQPEKWEPLCDEVPNLRGPCQHWAELWPGVAELPSREDVRDQLEHSSFRPSPVANSQ